MNIHNAAIDRINQSRKILVANMSAQPEVQYMAYIGALVETNILLDQFTAEHRKTMILYYTKMKQIIETEFINYCLKNGYKYLKSN